MKLLDQVRQLARVKHFSYRTEQAYVYWIKRAGAMPTPSRGHAKPKHFVPWFLSTYPSD